MNLTIAARVERKVLGRADEVKFHCNDCELIGDDEILALFPLAKPHLTIFLPLAGQQWLRDQRKDAELDEFRESLTLRASGGARLTSYLNSPSAEVFLGEDVSLAILPDIEKALASPNLYLWMNFEVPTSQRTMAEKAMREGGTVYLSKVPDLQLVQRHAP